MLRVACPHENCGKAYHVSEGALGRDVICKICGRSFVAEVSETEASPGMESNSGVDVLTFRPDFLSARQPNNQASSALHQIRQPARIGRFEIRDKLGQGAFGAVYRAYDPQLDREVAIKVPQSGLLTSPELVERFLREAKAAARLNHPHIVPVYDAGHDQGQYYIASALIHGQPLSELIGSYRGEFRRIAKLVRMLSEALDYAHHQGIVHRDLKPQNILIDKTGEPHLLDFGLALIADEAQKLTLDGTLMGTPAYMSPEQAAAKADIIGPASDQFSVGVILYELLVGHTPFAGSPEVIIFSIIHREPKAIRTHVPLAPRDLETICTKAMSYFPEARYFRAADVATDLGHWLNDEPIFAVRESLSQQLARWYRRNRIVATLVASVLLEAVSKQA